MESPRPRDVAPAERTARTPVEAPLRASGAHAAAGLAAAAGNRGLGAVIARMESGDGLLPGGVVHPHVQSAITAASGRGRPLDSGVAGRIAPRLGTGLGDVRIHTGPQAETLARAVEARAFTVGPDIFFGAGEYRPGTPEGDRLITHEVAHVVQQRGAQVSGPLRVSHPGDALEREAEALARDVVG